MVEIAPIVAFDFDGTLTCRDSFMAFLRWRAGPVGYGLGLARLAPAALAYATHRDRGRLKGAAVGVFLDGLSEADLGVAAKRFAEARWDRLMRSDALARWADWRRRGAHLAIVTASPQTLIAPFARRLGADTLIASNLAFDGARRLKGGLAGANCRGVEKVTRLKQVFGEDMILEAAYGDTAGDREMLAMARMPGYREFVERP